MKAFLREFKAFAMRGNVVDLAVAVVIGGAFGKIVSSLVENIIMPGIGLLLGGADFTDWTFTVGSATIAYGTFIQAVIDFLIIALVVFLTLRTFNRFVKRKEEKKPAPQPSEEVLILRDIRELLKK